MRTFSRKSRAASKAEAWRADIWPTSRSAEGVAGAEAGEGGPAPGAHVPDAARAALQIRLEQEDRVAEAGVPLLLLVQQPGHEAAGRGAGHLAPVALQELRRHVLVAGQVTRVQQSGGGGQIALGQLQRLAHRADRVARIQPRVPQRVQDPLAPAPARPHLARRSNRKMRSRSEYGANSRRPNPPVASTATSAPAGRPAPSSRVAASAGDDLLDVGRSARGPGRCPPRPPAGRAGHWPAPGRGRPEMVVAVSGGLLMRDASRATR